MRVNRYRFVSALLVIFLSQGAMADVLLPLAGMRRQPRNDCWAYSAAHLLEARLQKRDGLTIAFDIEKTVNYWQTYEYLLSSFIQKQPNSKLLNEAGHSSDFFMILGRHGFETFQPDVSNLKSIGFGGRKPDIEGAPDDGNGFSRRGEAAIRDLERELISAPSMTLEQAKQRVSEVLAQALGLSKPLNDSTSWNGEQIPLSEIYARALGPDLKSNSDGIANGPEKSYSPTDFVLIKPSEQSSGWFRYGDDPRFHGVFVSSTDELFRLIRVSLDRGWPTTFETSDHSVTVLGYKTVKEWPSGTSYRYAILNSGAASTPTSSRSTIPLGFDWIPQRKLDGVVVQSLMFFPALQSELPPAPEMPSYAGDEFYRVMMGARPLTLAPSVGSIN